MTLDEKIKVLEKYLQLKVEERDWHGVMDVAADLRELEILLKFMPRIPPINERMG